MRESKHKWVEPSAEELKSKELNDRDKCIWQYFINDLGKVEFTQMCEG